ncbi:MAG: imidazole glycerol phosphate synthase subunit HisF [Planctomycetaceae bacterium]|jgi:imidazole glycerol-phosphate synthase subunit HisF|nr:imidazole glycerol phosphate synthase subunit HisF [Planctomycetaceae bacterium]MBT6156048.1 imidazole glycerol phosphate synthase subunit HisF [Planctomycetaceae bacterium]MBT6487511.1 imidazole glycerol phosphate synthase subunit HisF [Planctomycetaceae bacterium]MBT6495862.1 imidazole glycerol phosphate synthase subunit HisF [Planctomycetaceae bacterium]
MLATRVIPCLLLRNRGFVKTVRFKKPTYLGDPINIVKIFNDKEVDELVLLDITATEERKAPNFELLADIAGEAFVPLGYGGGVNTIEHVKTLFNIGLEKVIINSHAFVEPELITRAADRFGCQSIVASIDVRSGWFGKSSVVTQSGGRQTKRDPVSYAVEMQERGAGEILLTSVDRDGTMSGYDIDLIRSVTEAVSVPVVACGGAGSVGDFAAAVSEGGASAVSAGSMFVFQGKHRAVLINFPSHEELCAVLPSRKEATSTRGADENDENLAESSTEQAA